MGNRIKAPKGAAKENPVMLIIRALRLWLEGKIRMVRIADGEVLEQGDDTFAGFRKVVVEPDANRPETSSH